MRPGAPATVYSLHLQPQPSPRSRRRAEGLYPQLGVGQCIGFSFESSFRDIWKDIVSVSYHCLRGLSNRIVPVFSFFLLKNYVSCIVLLPIFSHFLPQIPSCFPFPVVIFFPSPFSRSISEDLGLGITSALKMEEKSFLAAETFPNEDVF